MAAQPFSIVPNNPPIPDKAQSATASIGTGRLRETFTTGGGGGGGSVTDISMKDYVDAHLNAAQSATNSKFTEVMAKLTAIESRVDKIPGTATIFGAAITGVGIILAVLAFGGDRFDGGIQVATSSVQFLNDAKAASDQNARQIKALSEQLARRDADLQRILDTLASTQSRTEKLPIEPQTSPQIKTLPAQPTTP